MSVFRSTMRPSWLLCVVASLLAACLASSAVAQDLKWREPQLLLEESTKSAAPAMTSNVSETRPTATLQAPEVFKVPPPAVEYLPPPAPTTVGPPQEPFDPLGSYFKLADETLPAIEEWEQSIAPPVIAPLSPNKPGFFQQFGMSGSWMEGGTDDREPAMTDFSAYLTTAIPLPIREWPLNITAGYDMRFLDGPDQPDLPPRLYDAYVDFTWNLRITQRSTQVFSIAPGYYSDFKSNDNAFRVTGKWVSAYDIVKQRLTLLSGTLYIGRQDIKLLPMGGLVWTPSEWTRIEAVFPNPRASIRLFCTETSQDWLYTGADFYGGQTWAIERADTSHDRVTITENRAVLGYERRRAGGAGWHLESGWVFDRRIRYRSGPGDDYNPDPTFYVRAGFTL